MLTLILLSTLLVYGLFVLWSRRHIYLLHEQLKNETWSFPILGNLLHFIGDDEVRMKALQKFGRIAMKQGGMTSMWLGPKYFMVVADAEVAELILKTCLDKDENMLIARELFGNGSIFAPVDIWRGRRKVVAPTFSVRNLNRFAEVFCRQSATMVARLSQAAGQGTFSIWKYITTYTMDSVCESTLGVKVDAQLNSAHPFIDAFDNHCRMASFRLLLPPWAQQGYKYLPVYHTYLHHIHCMHRFVDDVIRKKQIEQEVAQKENAEYEETQKTFLELLMASPQGLSAVGMREESLVMMLAGTDTSAVGAAFTALMLAAHGDVQQRAYEEIQEVLGDKEEITAADLRQFKYLEAVVKETLRLYPPVPVIVRRVHKDLTLPSGLTINKDTSVMVNIWATHRNPRYWGSDAEDFKPERFLDGNPTHSAAFIPFSHGSRSCLGYQYAMMSMKMAISSLLRRYRLLADERCRAPLRVKFDVMMKHVDDFPLKIERRSKVDAGSGCKQRTQAAHA